MKYGVRATEINPFYKTTPEITGRIIAYLDGEIPFADLLTELSERDYKDPPRYHKVLDQNGVDDAYGDSVAGTIEELYQAKALGLLTADELEAILSGAWEAHTGGN